MAEGRAAGVTGNSLIRVATGAPAGVRAAAGSLSLRADSQMAADLAEANTAEIEAARIALEKSRNEATRGLARQMLQDHGASLQELQKLAADKSIALPSEPGQTHKTMAAALQATMPGDSFDEEYYNRAGLGDHLRTTLLLQKILRTSKDDALKGVAARLLPALRQHLQTAQQLAASQRP